MFERCTPACSRICWFALLFGALVSCMTLALCSIQALDSLCLQLRSLYECWDPAIMAACGILLPLAILLPAFSALGCVWISLFNALIGFAAGMLAAVSLYAGPTLLYPSVPLLLSVVPLQRISGACMELSADMLRMLRSGGKRSFDLRWLLGSVLRSTLFIVILIALQGAILYMPQLHR